MDQEQVRQILRQIAGGNSVFDTNSSEVSRMLGYSPEIERTEEEAASLRYHLDTLAGHGAISPLFESTAGSVTTDLTPKGRDMLRRLGG